MTVIAIRDGVMAVDSYIGADGTRCGWCKKWLEVPEHWGGGYVAAAGNFGAAMSAMERFCADGQLSGPEGSTILWLRSNGEVLEAYDGQIIRYDAPFFAAGSGESLARGAMAAGATAEDAVRIACDWSDTCGGEIHVLRVSP